MSVIPPFIDVDIPVAWLKNYAKDLHEKLVNTHQTLKATQQALSNANKLLEQQGEQLVRFTEMANQLTDGLPYHQEYQKAR